MKKENECPKCNGKGKPSGERVTLTDTLIDSEEHGEWDAPTLNHTKTCKKCNENFIDTFVIIYDDMNEPSEEEWELEEVWGKDYCSLSKALKKRHRLTYLPDYLEELED